jgi:hypothetical protein
MSLVLGILALLFELSWAPLAQSKKLSDYQPFEYEVRFTNPLCAIYRYPEPVQSASGDTLTQMPRNVFCSSQDEEASSQQDASPMRKLLEWIRDPNTHEIFFAALSFSNDTLRDELCRAIEERGVKLRFVLDRGTSLADANKLLACAPPSAIADREPEMFLRGDQGSLGFAHIKLFIVNPSDPQTFRVAFGSANMSSGIVTHHENWNFVTTSPRSYFAQNHLCAIHALVEAGDSKASFREFMTSCRAKIQGPPEEDIQSYFAPADGSQASAVLLKAIASSHEIEIAAHRFSYNKMREALDEKLSSPDPARVKIVLDDDLYWAGHHHNTGPNTFQEFLDVDALVEKGAEARYMQTNQWEHQLHHNKFMIFNDAGNGAPAVFTGAGNFTGAAFKDNFEDFYLVQIPSVVEAFEKQYRHLFDELATPPSEMPTEIYKPVRVLN